MDFSIDLSAMIQAVMLVVMLDYRRIINRLVKNEGRNHSRVSFIERHLGVKLFDD